MSTKTLPELSQEIFDLLMELRKSQHFNFGLRTKGDRLKKGLWFQGTENYISIGLSDLGAGNLSTQSICLLVDKETENFGLTLILEYPKNTSEKLRKIYEEIALKLQMKSNKKLYYKGYNSSENILENIKSFFIKDYQTILAKIIENDGTELLISDKKFDRNLSRIRAEQLQISKRSTSSVPRRYWKFAPGENAVRWNDFRANGTMQMAYPELSEEVIKNAATKEELRNGLNLPTSSKKLQNLNNFLFEAQVGDIVFANKGRSIIVGVGIISGEYECMTDPLEYNHTRAVDWIADKEWNYITNSIENYPVLFAMDTFSETPNGDWILREYLKTFPEYASRFNHQNDTIMISEPLNQILYGPPGTGKTLRLKTDYFPQYTTKETAISPEKHFEEVVRNLTWWQVIAVAVIELGKCKVADILKHEWVVQKAKLSNSNTIRPPVWGQLQSHTIESCEFVNVKAKQQPFIFNKTADSVWEILEEEVQEQVPELYEIIESVKNFIPNPDKEIKRYEFTTFHQSFGYEDFMEGIKPVLDEGNELSDVGYRIEDGIFMRLCKRAESDPENKYAIFIDEINRGNISAIFGELISLIETDKRTGTEHELSVILPYSKKTFSVPKNLYIIGTMNTADRSVEALDTALRRRFSFVEMLPDPKLLSDKGTNGDGMIADINLADLLTVINDRIEVLVDRDHTIGHAFFINDKSPDDLKHTFKNKIIPLLQEYFYGNYQKMALVLGNSFFSIKEQKSVKFAEEAKDYDFSDQVYTIRDCTDEDFDFLNAIRKLMNKPVQKDNKQPEEATKEQESEVTEQANG